MLPSGTVPVYLLQVLQVCRGVFTGPSFVTFTLLVTGALSGVGPRTVAGMWSAAGLVVKVPFATRSVCLPVLFRLHRPKQTASKPGQARELIEVIAAAFGDRRVDVVADNAYKSPAWQRLPAAVTFITRLASNAVLYAPAPPRTGRRGRPALKGAKLGTPAVLASTASWRRARVHRYGDDNIVDLAVISCL
jgi:hypothetical protein